MVHVCQEQKAWARQAMGCVFAVDFMRGVREDEEQQCRTRPLLVLCQYADAHSTRQHSTPVPLHSIDIAWLLLSAHSKGLSEYLKNWGEEVKKKKNPNASFFLLYTLLIPSTALRSLASSLPHVVHHRMLSQHIQGTCTRIILSDRR